MSEQIGTAAPPRDSRLRPVTEGEWAGWSFWHTDAFEQRAGPFYERVDDEGNGISAFRAGPEHMNGGGFMHGGCLMTFADSALFTIARGALQIRSGSRSICRAISSPPHASASSSKRAARSPAPRARRSSYGDW